MKKTILSLLTLAGPIFSFPEFILRNTDPDSGFYRETLLPTDIDNDGDMDFFSGEGRGSPVWWFENQDGGWVRHLANDSNVNDVGAALHDFNEDGWMDRVSSSFWYRNPGFENWDKSIPPPKFEACRYSNQQYLHDVLVGDINGDDRVDIITISYDGIRWFKAPPPESTCGLWETTAVNGQTLNPQQHGGIAVGDLDGDGDNDIARVDRWFENITGAGDEWLEHINIPFGQNYTGGWGQSGRAQILDLNSDGANDILQTECDLPNGRVAWMENVGGKGLEWVLHIIKDSTDGQDFHSLAAGDFDGDGDRDIFSAGASHSASDTNRAYIWENLNGDGSEWKEHLIYQGIADIHDANFEDMDGDGDLDILAKIFGMDTHFVWVNQTIPNGLNPRYHQHQARRKTQESPGFNVPKRGLVREMDGLNTSPFAPFYYLNGKKFRELESPSESR
jgi:hypothetical protein